MTAPPSSGSADPGRSDGCYPLVNEPGNSRGDGLLCVRSLARRTGVGSAGRAGPCLVDDDADRADERQPTISQGTGFFFASTTADGKADTVFLVTNYHVVTGHAPLSTQPKTGDRIWFVLHEDPADLTRVRPVELPLYDAMATPSG